MRQEPIVLETLGDLRRAGYQVIGNCSGKYCGRARRLNLDALIQRFGESYSFVNESRIGAALRCEGCGHRGGALTIAAPS